jgi:hypothetical protein
MRLNEAETKLIQQARHKIEMAKMRFIRLKRTWFDGFRGF